MESELYGGIAISLIFSKLEKGSVKKKEFKIRVRDKMQVYSIDCRQSYHDSSNC